jgi:hypothetical protein
MPHTIDQVTQDLSASHQCSFLFSIQKGVRALISALPATVDKHAAAQIYMHHAKAFESCKIIDLQMGLRDMPTL